MFATIKKLYRLLFKDDIRLHRGKGGVKVKLGGAPAKAPKLQRKSRDTDNTAERANAEHASMCNDLAALFGNSAAMRRQLPQLASVEQALRTNGLEFLKAMPLPQLREALRQFDGAVVNWSPVGLACLRSKMAVALRERLRSGESEVQAEPATGSYPALGAAQPSHVEATELPEDDEAALLAAYGGMTADAAGGKPAGR